MFVLENEGRRSKKKCVYAYLGSGTAVPSFWCFVCLDMARDGTAVPVRARAVPSFWSLGLQNFSFS